MLNLPNILSLARVAIVPVLVVLFFIGTTDAMWAACALFLLAAVTDFLDGYIARATGQQSAFGRFIDPVADKVLVSATLMMMVAFGQIAGYAILPALVILCREIIVSGLREHLAELNIGVPVSQLAKWKTTIQLIAIAILFLAGMKFDGIPVREIGEAGLWIAAVLTLITGYDYLRAGLANFGTPKETETPAEEDAPADGAAGRPAAE